MTGTSARGAAVTGRIRQADTFTADEERRLFLWGADVFDTSHLRRQWRAKDVHFFWDVDDRPVNHVGVLKHVVRVNGLPVTVGGLSVPAAEQKIAKALRDGGFVLKPQVNVSLLQVRSAQISILGQVGKPGRYPIETVNSKVSEMIAAAGGVVPGAADVVTVVGTRNGKQVKFDIDLPAILQSGKTELDAVVVNGDILYVDRAPMVYIYGEVQRPGAFRLERGMTVMQALAQGGAYFSSTMFTKVLQEFTHLSRRRDLQEVKGIDALTEREKDVLRLVAKGSTNRDIAGELIITENTVKVHLRNILDKLQLRNRQQAAAYAVQEGLVSRVIPSNNGEYGHNGMYNDRDESRSGSIPRPDYAKARATLANYRLNVR